MRPLASARLVPKLPRRWVEVRRAEQSRPASVQALPVRHVAWKAPGPDASRMQTRVPRGRLGALPGGPSQEHYPRRQESCRLCRERARRLIGQAPPERARSAGPGMWPPVGPAPDRLEGVPKVSDRNGRPSHTSHASRHPSRRGSVISMREFGQNLPSVEMRSLRERKTSPKPLHSMPRHCTLPVLC